MKKLLTFHGKQEIKDAHIANLQRHYDLDEIIQGLYWDNGKGCDNGCSVIDKAAAERTSYAKQLEIELGMPLIISKLRDKIFEGLNACEAKEFTLNCSKAIPVGVDLENVWRKLMIWILTDEESGVIKFAKTEKTKSSIQDISNAFSDSLTKSISREKWIELRKASAAAAYAAYAADAYAAAAYAAAYAAAAYAADAAADDAADAADAYAADAARQKYYSKMAKKLIELLKEAKYNFPAWRICG